LPAYKIYNRKYIGSKRELGNAIIGTILAATGIPGAVLDGFLGTGVITAGLLQHGVKKVYAVDNLYQNTVILKGFTADPSSLKNINKHLSSLNSLPGKQGYITAWFASTYFTPGNCMRMDAVRDSLYSLHNAGGLNDDEYYYLLASFLLGADRVANTVGQYDAFLKHMGSAEYKEGKHVVDKRVYDEFKLRPLELIAAPSLSVVTKNILECISEIGCDTAYFDPPYNTRQYCDNYHILENLARWEKPQVFGKTAKFNRSQLKSPFSRRRHAAKALYLLIAGTRARNIFLSYNSEGIVQREQLMEICGCMGSVTLYEFPYMVFGKGAGVAKKRPVTEYLLHLKR
jgi:adenine-specific DNA-methyltransferase